MGPGGAPSRGAAAADGMRAAETAAGTETTTEDARWTAGRLTRSAEALGADGAARQHVFFSGVLGAGQEEPQQAFGAAGTGAAAPAATNVVARAAASSVLKAFFSILSLGFATIRPLRYFARLTGQVGLTAFRISCARPPAASWNE